MFNLARQPSRTFCSHISPVRRSRHHTRKLAEKLGLIKSHDSAVNNNASNSTTQQKSPHHSFIRTNSGKQVFPNTPQEELYTNSFPYAGDRTHGRERDFSNMVLSLASMGNFSAQKLHSTTSTMYRPVAGGPLFISGGSTSSSARAFSTSSKDMPEKPENSNEKPQKKKSSKKNKKSESSGFDLSSYARVSTGLLGMVLTVPLLFPRVMSADDENTNLSDSGTNSDTINAQIEDKSLSRGERLLLKRLNSTGRVREETAGEAAARRYSRAGNTSNKTVMNEMPRIVPITDRNVPAIPDFNDDAVHRVDKRDVENLYVNCEYDYHVKDPTVEDLSTLVILSEQERKVWPWVWAGPNDYQSHHVICLDADSLFFPINNPGKKSFKKIRDGQDREELLQDFLEVREKQQGALKRLIENYNACDARGTSNFLVVFTGDCDKRKGCLRDGTASFELPQEWKDFFEKNQMGMIWSDVKLLDHSNKIMMLQDERIIVYDSLHLMY